MVDFLMRSAIGFYHFMKRNISCVTFLALVGTFVGGSSCLHATIAEINPSPMELVISDISPSSGPAGIAYPIQVTIRGRGFMLTGNTVTFGPVQIPDLPSPDGQHITFFVPKEVPSSGEVPPMVLPYGEYPVTVTTLAGTSVAIRFTLTRQR
jgi:hypothetical protein